MSGNDLKSKLAAKLAADRTNQDADEDATRKYHQVLLREYPRLCQQLLERVQALVGGVEGVTVHSKIDEQNLKFTHGSTATGFTETNVGKVRVPTFAISVRGVPMIGFRPDGTGIVGAHGAIAVESRKVAEKRLLMVSTKDIPDTWVLAVRDTQNPTFSRWWKELTDDLLNTMLEQALL
jgi:hypothetical protein